MEKKAKVAEKEKKEQVSRKWWDRSIDRSERIQRYYRERQETRSTAK